MIKKLTILLATTLALLPNIAKAQVFEDPLDGLTVLGILGNIVGWLLYLSGAVALLALIYGGFRLVLGGIGSEQEVANAKRIIYWAILGLLIIGLASVILYTISNSILGIGVSL